MAKKARRTEKQKLMREYEEALQEERKEEERQRLLEEEAEEAYYRFQLQREEEAYERRLIAEATCRRAEDSREAYLEWLLDHPGFDPYGDLADSANERWYDYWKEDIWHDYL